MPRSAVGHIGHSGNIRTYSDDYHPIVEMRENLVELREVLGNDTQEQKAALENAKAKCGCNSCKGIRPGLPEVPIAAPIETCKCNLCKITKPPRRLIDWLNKENPGANDLPNWLIILMIIALAIYVFTMAGVI